MIETLLEKISPIAGIWSRIVTLISIFIVGWFILKYITYDVANYLKNTLRIKKSNKYAVSLIIYKNDDFRDKAVDYVSKHKLVSKYEQENKNKIVFCEEANCLYSYRYNELKNIAEECKYLYENIGYIISGLNLDDNESRIPPQIHLFFEGEVSQAIAYPIAWKFDNAKSVILYFPTNQGSFVCAQNMSRSTKTDYDYKSELLGGLYEYFGE